MAAIVLTNWMLSGRSGMELYIRDLALGLKQRGWEPWVFSLTIGAPAEELRAAGVRVVTRLDELPPDAAIVHGHHNFMTVMALLVCQKARGLFVCHASLFWQEEPPVFPRILSYVGVDDLCRERVAADLACPLETIRFIGNSVDMVRFTPRAPLPEKPRRALLFSNYAAEHTFLPVVRAACQQEGIDLEVIGSGVLHQVPDPERVLKDYDLVFAKARCAMESLATGCATVLCGTDGIGPLVTRENFDRLRRDNFGRRCLPLPMTVENLVAGMRQYSAADSRAVTDHARAELDLKHTVDQWCALYEELRTLPCPFDAGAEALAAATMLGKLGAPLFRTFELESVKDYLQHEAKGLGERLALLQNEQTVMQEKMQRALAEAGSQHEASAHLRAKLKQVQEEKKRYRNERDVARQNARTGMVVKGALAWMWRHRVFRPIAKLMGVRALPGKSRCDDPSGAEP